MAAYRVVLTPAAERQLGKLSPRAREMIAAALVALGRNPRPPGCSKLSGADDLWRIRVRQFRVIYQILDDQLTIVVVKIGDRKDVYIRISRRIPDSTESRSR
jgi:mRNA interferase RelE/StbE